MSWPWRAASSPEGTGRRARTEAIRFRRKAHSCPSSGSANKHAPATRGPHAWRRPPTFRSRRRCAGRGIGRRHQARARPRVGQGRVPLRGRGPQVCRGQPDGDLQPCSLDQPAQVNHPAAKSLMVLYLESLMARLNPLRATGWSKNDPLSRSQAAATRFEPQTYRLTLWWFCQSLGPAGRSETVDFDSGLRDQDSNLEPTG